MASKTKIKRRVALAAAAALATACAAVAVACIAAGGPAQLAARLEQAANPPAPEEPAPPDPHDIGSGFVLKDSVLVFRGEGGAISVSANVGKANIATADSPSKGDVVYVTSEEQEERGALGSLIKVETVTPRSGGIQVTGTVPSLGEAVATIDGEKPSSPSIPADLEKFLGDRTIREADKENSPKLTAEQKSAIGGYGEDQEKVLSLLKASVWVADGGSSSLRFGDNSVIYAKGEKTSSQTFAIASVDEGQEISGSDAKIETTICAILTDDGSHIMTISKSTSSIGTIEYSVSSDAFTGSKTPFARQNAATSFTVTGMNAQIEALLGGHDDEAREQIKEYAAVYYPTASEAAWSKYAQLDWEDNTLVTSFSLNTKSTANVVLTYDMANQTVSVGKK